MNKKFFTLMAALLVGGAAMPSEAFAQATKDSTNIGSSVDLKNGLKFILGSHHSTQSGNTAGTFFSLQDSADVVIYKDSVALFTDAPVFEIRNFDAEAYTFNLYVNGKKFVKSYGGNTYSTFFAGDPTNRTNKAGFTKLNYVKKGGASEVVFDNGYATTYTRTNVQNAGSLNANEGSSVKFSYPGATPAPEDNKFGASLIAVKWSDAASVFGVTGSTSADSVMFVLNNDAGKAWTKNAANMADADKLKAATFVVINPTSHLAIQALDVTKAEGQTIAYVSGDKLSAAGSALKDKALDKVNVWNAVYGISQADELNAADDYNFGAQKVDAFSSNGSRNSNNSVVIGAYSAGVGSPYYVTTLMSGTGQKYVNAQVGGSNFADTKALLKADGQAMYNIFLCGGAQGDAWYGKYLASQPGDGNDAYSPNQAANLKSADAVYIVTGAGDRGQLKLINARTLADEMTLTLYATDEANVYEVANYKSAIADKKGASKIKLIPAEMDAYKTLSKDELAQSVELVFNGVGVVTVNDIYMSHPADSVFEATTNPNYSFKWLVEKGDTITKRYSYAVLKDNNVIAKADSISLQPYVLYSTDNKDGQKRYLAHVNGTGGNAGATWMDTTYVAANKTQVVFKNSLYNTVNAILVSAGNRDFDSDIAGTTKVDFLAADLGEGTVDSLDINDLTLNHLIDVKVNTASTIAPSLPAVSRHATIIADGAGIDMKANKDGLLEGIISDEPLTFWLDTADSEKETPKFYFSKGIAATETKADEADAVQMRNFLYNPADSCSYWDADNAVVVTDPRYYLSGTRFVKAIFRPAALVAEDTLLTVKEDKPVYVAAASKANVCEGGLNRFQFTVTEAGDEGYYVKSGNDYLFNLNGKLGFTATKADALIITLGEGDATANEAIAAESGVQVIGGQGVVTVQGAAGKVITVANILGQTIANQVAASDNVTIAAPAGVVVVAVDGEATKVVVK